MIRTQPRKQNIATSTLASLALSFPHFWCGPLSHVGHVFAFVTGGPLASPSDKCKTARSTTISSASSPGSPHQSFAQQPESCIEDPEAPTAIPQVLWTQGSAAGGVALTIYQAQIGCTRRSSCSLCSPCALAKHWRCSREFPKSCAACRLQVHLVMCLLLPFSVMKTNTVRHVKCQTFTG